MMNRLRAYKQHEDHSHDECHLEMAARDLEVMS